MGKLSRLMDKASHTLSEGKLPISKEFYMKHLGKVIVVLFLLYSYVQLRYQYDQAVYDVSELKKELNNARYTSIAKWGELTRHNSPEHIRNQITNAADLETSSEAAFLLK